MYDLLIKKLIYNIKALIEIKKVLYKINQNMEFIEKNKQDLLDNIDSIDILKIKDNTITITEEVIAVTKLLEDLTIVKKNI
ncbi:MAG: hypothetical protein SNJ71_04630 [Bacteroidales bacterium]